MKQKIYTLLFVVVVIATAQLSHAQSPYTLKQVIVLNQGPYGGPVSVGSYDPAKKTYQDFDNLPQLRFASYVIIDNGYIYVAADSLLIKYDLNTKQKLATQVVHGIREIAVWGNELLVTRGDVSALNSYFQVYDASTLNFIYELSSVSGASEGVKVLGDTAYVAVNDFGVGNVGKLAVIDLKNQIENREIDLGSSGYNPFDVEVEKTNNTVYTVNNLNYNGTSITKYTPSTGTFTTKTVNSSSPCNGSTYYLDNIYFQTSSDNNIQVFRTSQLSIWDSLVVTKTAVGMAADSVHGYMYVGSTDYASYGTVSIYDLYGNTIDTFSADVDPSNYAFDVRSASGFDNISSFATIEMYPNPVTNQLRVIMNDSKDAQARLTLTDILGRQVYEQQISTNAYTLVPMDVLSQGLYFLKAETANGELTRKIVKE